MEENTPAVVVVDDDASMSQALDRLLNAAGLRARVFGSAEEMLLSGEAGGADCFVFDVQLPGLSGFELRHQLVEAGISTPVIFITAYDEGGAQEQAEREGASGYFIKPFAGSSLVAAIRKAMGSARPFPS